MLTTRLFKKQKIKAPKVLSHSVKKRTRGFQDYFIFLKQRYRGLLRDFLELFQNKTSHAPRSFQNLSRFKTKAPKMLSSSLKKPPIFFHFLLKK